MRTLVTISPSPNTRPRMPIITTKASTTAATRAIKVDSLAVSFVVEVGMPGVNIPANAPTATEMMAIPAVGIGLAMAAVKIRPPIPIIATRINPYAIILST